MKDIIIDSRDLTADEYWKSQGKYRFYATLRYFKHSSKDELTQCISKNDYSEVNVFLLNHNTGVKKQIPTENIKRRGTTKMGYTYWDRVDMELTVNGSLIRIVLGCPGVDVSPCDWESDILSSLHYQSA